MLFGGIRKQGHNTMTKKVYAMFLIKVVPNGKDLLDWAENLCHKKIGKSWSQPVMATCPTGCVAQIGSIWADTAPRRKQNPAHSGRPEQQDEWHLGQYQARKSRMTAPQWENRATVASLPEWDEVSSEVTYEWKSMVHLQAHSWKVSRLACESQRCICKHVLRGELTCEWKSTTHLQARSWEVSWLASESQQCICKHILKRL